MAHSANNMVGAISVQLDLATFPGHDLRDIEDFLSIEISLGTDQDNGSCTVTCAAVPPDAAERVRLYVYFDDGGGAQLVFNGEIVAMGWVQSENDHVFTLNCRDAMARLRNKWTLDDRTYTSATEGSVIQNLVEASAIDASLTSIVDTSWLIGVAQAVILHGGIIDVLTGDPGQADVPLDLIRKIDESTPLYVTYSGGDGAVYRKARTLGSSVGSFSTGGGNCWNVTRQRSADEVVNACKVIGLPLAGIPLESLFQATSAWVFDPPKYITEELDSYLIEDQTQADIVSAAIVGYKNGRKNVVTVTTTIDPYVFPADTIEVTDSFCQLSSTEVFVTNIKHSIGSDDATMVLTGEFYEA